VKKAISAPLCSGLIIPGLGQIINQDIKKGLALLACVFVLFIVGAVKLYLIMSDAFQSAAAQELTAEAVYHHVLSADFTAIWIVAVLFVLAWAYAVADAFVRGRRIDNAFEDTPHESLPHR